MAEGVRVRATDPVLANKTIRVEHPLRPGKNYHIRLDDQASVIVSHVVWRRYQELMQLVPACPRLVLEHAVSRPPAQGINGRMEMRPLLAVLDGQLVEVGKAPIPTIR